MQVAICLMIFEACINILFIIKVKVLLPINWLYRFPPVMLTIAPRRVSRFWARSQISFWHLFLDLHLTTHHSNIGVQIIAMLDLGTSTLGAFQAFKFLQTCELKVCKYILRQYQCSFNTYQKLPVNQIFRLTYSKKTVVKYDGLMWLLILIGHLHLSGT